ncbi:MAG: malonate decarboxylase holo-ACP synthase [Azospirillaceae bacterium]|nr:malonate decarboxylase holo-ACP synthase [Azospirillaceae bacterium]
MACSPVRVHDLLRIADATAVTGDGACPEWVPAALDRAPWVVVRRQAPCDGRIAVGVRGAGRERRWAGWLSPAAIVECRSPEQLLAAAGSVATIRQSAVPALRLLAPVAALMAAVGWAWGPVGSIGFELASGQPTATATSDLDLIIRAPRPLPLPAAAGIAAALAGLGARTDPLIEVPGGAVSLIEWAGSGSGGGVALRTTRGPRLVANPWQPDAPLETRISS